MSPAQFRIRWYGFHLKCITCHIELLTCWRCIRYEIHHVRLYDEVDWTAGGNRNRLYSISKSVLATQIILKAAKGKWEGPHQENGYFVCHHWKPSMDNTTVSTTSELETRVITARLDELIIWCCMRFRPKKSMSLSSGVVWALGQTNLWAYHRGRGKQQEWSIQYTNEFQQLRNSRWKI